MDEEHLGPFTLYENVTLATQTIFSFAAIPLFASRWSFFLLTELSNVLKNLKKVSRFLTAIFLTALHLSFILNELHGVGGAGEELIPCSGPKRRC